VATTEGQEQDRLASMPITDVEIRDLRRRYEAAYDAYQSYVRAAVDLENRGELSPQLLASKAKALGELNQARESYRSALARIGFLSGNPSL
jgi:hypothetical protein